MHVYELNLVSESVGSYVVIGIFLPECLRSIRAIYLDLIFCPCTVEVRLSFKISCVASETFRCAITFPSFFCISCFLLSALLAHCKTKQICSSPPSFRSALQYSRLQHTQTPSRQCSGRGMWRSTILRRYIMVAKDVTTIP
jgi:hypothetical protein